MLPGVDLEGPAMDMAILGRGAARARSRNPMCRRWGESMGLPRAVSSSRAGALPDPPQCQGRLPAQSSPSEAVCVKVLVPLPFSKHLSSLARSKFIELLFQRKAEDNGITEKKTFHWLLPSLNATHLARNCIFIFDSQVQVS